METIVEIKNIVKKYQNKSVFEDFSLSINRGEFIVIIGKSGTGKSTLLNMLGLLDKPDKGTIKLFDKINVKPYSRQAEALLRNDIGYLFQNFSLIDNESVYNNLLIAIPKGKKRDKAEAIRNVLEEVGLVGYESKLIHKCSGGEQQRIAVARLLLKSCSLILADEPTGSLDYENKMIVVEQLKKLQISGKTIIVVTHDKELEKYADRVIELS